MRSFGSNGYDNAANAESSTERDFTVTPATIPSPPVAQPATYIAANSFTANWISVSGATGYRLDVSTSNSFASYLPGYQNLDCGKGLSHSVTGLNASTTYYYRVRAYNSTGTSGNSNVINVTTLNATGPPVIVTSLATLIASSSAQLNGSVDLQGLTTTVRFEYGKTTNYGATTASQSKMGSAYQNVNAVITGLISGTAYHFRIVGTNSAGTTYGADRIFTAVPPDQSVTWQNNPVHDGFDPASPLAPPLTLKWTRDFSASGVTSI